VHLGVKTAPNSTGETPGDILALNAGSPKKFTHTYPPHVCAFLRRRRVDEWLSLYFANLGGDATSFNCSDVRLAARYDRYRELDGQRGWFAELHITTPEVFDVRRKLTLGQARQTRRYVRAPACIAAVRSPSPTGDPHRHAIAAQAADYQSYVMCPECSTGFMIDSPADAHSTFPHYTFVSGPDSHGSFDQPEGLYDSVEGS
jgi:hypothetical protein